MATDSEWAWVAGLLEGEGYFNIREQSIGGFWVAEIRCRMCDRDVIEKLHRTVGVGNLNGPYERGENHQDQWEWRCSRREHVRTVLAKCEPWFGSRRGKRAREMLAAMPPLIPYPVDYMKTLYSTGWTQREIAAEVGLTQRTVHKCLHGHPTGGYYAQPLHWAPANPEIQKAP